MTLQRKIIRSVKKNLSFYLTGSLLAAVTVMLLIGAFSVSESLYAWADAYYEKTKIEDGSFQTQRPIGDAELSQLEQAYDLELERQTYVDVAYHDGRLRLFSPTEKMNRYTISEGSGLTQTGELLLTYRYAKANGIAVGDTVEMAGTQFTVCGLMMKPDYAVMLYDLTETIPDNDGFGIGMLDPEDLAAAGGGAEQYSVRYHDWGTESAFRTKIYEAYGTQEYIEREANSRISLIYSEADDLVAEFSLYAPIIMIIVVAVIAMVLMRTVKREGKTIGTLLALGYRKNELVRHYLVYGLVSVLVLNQALKTDAVSLLCGLQKEKTVHLFRNCRGSVAFIYNVRTVFINGLRSATLVIGIAVATLCIVLTSNHLLVPVGFVLGVPLGYLTAYSMIVASAASSGMYMGLPVKGSTILVSLVIVAAAYALALCFSRRKLGKILKICLKSFII